MSQDGAAGGQACATDCSRVKIKGSSGENLLVSPLILLVGIQQGKLQ